MNRSTDEKQVDGIIQCYRAHRLIAPIFARLETELPKTLTYHSPNHSDDVFCEAIRFAVIDNVPERGIELVALAAAYHDAGFLVRVSDNEEIGADMLVTAMLNDGTYSSNEIEQARTMVLDTKLVEGNGGMQQRPQTELSKYLLDADLSNLGRSDFFERLESLRKERNQGQREALKESVVLMQAHTWFSASAKHLRQAQKDQNLDKLLEMLKQLDSATVNP